MRFGLSYVPAEDRLQLVWQDPDGAHRLWLTRRHALALLWSLDGLSMPDRPAPAPPGGSAGADDVAAVAAAVVDVPAGAGPADVTAAVDSRETLVLGARLSREGARLALRTGGGTVNVSLPGASGAELREALRDIAERAGWDPAAGLLRFGSARLAREAIEKARGA